MIREVSASERLPSSGVLEMLLGMLELLLFHESTEGMKDVSLMHRYENGKHEGYGNEGSLCGEFLLFMDNAECFFCFVFFEGWTKQGGDMCGWK